MLYELACSFDYAEEVFRTIIAKDMAYAESSDVFFRLGVIYKLKKNFGPSMAVRPWFATACAIRRRTNSRFAQR